MRLILCDELVEEQKEDLPPRFAGDVEAIDRAYGIVDLNEREPIILETNAKERLFEVRSVKDRGKFYRVDADIKVCTCPDFNFRFLKCKHIIAAEFASGITS